MPLRPTWLSIPMVAVAALLLPLPLAAQTLRYGGDEGDSSRYRLSNSARIRQEFQGTATDLTVTSFSLLDLVLQRATEDTLTYGVTLDSLSLSFEGADVPPPDLRPVTDRRMTLKVSPRGQVYAFDLPPDMPQAPPGIDLKQMVSHFFPRLPEGRAPAGTQWTDPLTLPVSQQGIQSDVRVVTTYTSRGEARTPEGEFVAVDYGTETTLHGEGEQQGAPLVLDGTGRGTGTILFAEDGERFWSSKGTQTLDLQVEISPAGQAPVRIPVKQEVTAEIQHL
ncbi:MAG: hypothetical protein ABR599_02970 [Gemmatimonadota bacterium]